MKSIHAELDQRILSAIRGGRHRFCELLWHLGLANFRKLDRRLQALRKKGVITFDRKSGWQVSK